MQTQVFKSLVAGTILLLLAGCDYGRSGRYRIALTQPTQPVTESAQIIAGSEQEQIVSLLQSFLSEREFRQLRPDYWTREGADVFWQLTASDEVRLSVGAFGAKRELRESERVELGVIRFLLAQPGVRVSPDDSLLRAPIK